MSGMYNVMFGVNPLGPLILATLGLEPTQVGRYRDAFVSNGRIAVLTRNGGGNRDDHHEVFEFLRAHPLYITDEDEEYDTTYATVWFAIPEQYAEDLKKVDIGELNMRKRWEDALAKLKSGDPEMLARSAPMMEQFKKAFEKGPGQVSVIVTGRDPKKVLDEKT